MLQMALRGRVVSRGGDLAVFRGSRGNDQYFGTALADEIYGLDGQDQLRGASGDDHIEGGNGPDSLYGDQGDDCIHGGLGDDVIRGGRGEDTIRGGPGVDVLFGDRDGDLLFGEDGADILLGGPGDDVLRGGSGSDYLDGGEGERDAVSYLDSPVDRYGTGVDVALNDSVLVVGRGGHAKGDILVGIEIVIGSAGDDRLSATNNGRVDHLFGEGGDDTLRGGGFDHPDLLDGGAGDDHLLALSHGGTMTGGPGDDLFEYSGSRFSGGEVTDFTKGQDAIVFDFFVGDISMSDLNTMLRNSQGNVLDLSLLGPGFDDFGKLALNVPVSTLDASDFIIS